MTKQLQYQNKKLTYRITGQGPAVVLVHGFAEDGRIWAHQEAFLQQHFQVIVPDLPGSGKSDLIDDMSMEGMADSIHAILQTENLQQCTLIGHSMGGYITLAFAEKFPSRLSAFGLFHSTAFADTEEKIAARKKGIQTINEKGALKFLKGMIPSLYGSYTQMHHSSIIEEHVQQASYFSNQSLIAYYDAMMKRPDRTTVLKQNKLPVLIVLGKYDNTIPLADGLKLAHIPILSYIHILEVSGHMGMREEWQKSNEILNDFLLKTN